MIEDGVTQTGMAFMAKLANSSISRAISGKKISSITSSAKLKMRYTIADTRNVLSPFIKDKVLVEKKTQCFYNFKGGVGKTSICFQVVTHLALMGFNVLVIDADPQGHLSTSIGFNTDEKFFTLHDAIAGVKSIEDIIQNVFEGLDCVPANLSLTKAEVTLNELPKREERISLILSSIKDNYDFIIFDTNPTISYLNRNIITCCDVMNIIVETQAYSLNGLKLVLGDIMAFTKSMVIKMPEILMFPNKYEDRTATSTEAMTLLNKYYSNYLKPNFAIRKSEDFNIASKQSKALAFFCRNNSIAFEDVLDVVHHIIEKTCSKKVV